MEDRKTKAEALRLMSGKTRRANTRARWENVYRMYSQGRSFEQIGKWIGKSPSTARQLLKRAAMEQSKAPGFQWPVDKDGKKICDIPLPMPSDVPVKERSAFWVHVRGRKTGNQLCYCPVCKKSYLAVSSPKTLCEVFAAESSSSGCAPVTSNESMAGCNP